MKYDVVIIGSGFGGLTCASVGKGWSQGPCAGGALATRWLYAELSAQGTFL